MSHVVGQLTSELQPSLHALGLTPVLYLVLGQVFASPGVTPAELARACSLSPQHTGMVLERAERNGWVVREGDRGRGRRTSVALTQAGISVLERGWPVVHDAGSHRLTASQHRQLQALLDLYRDPDVNDGDVVVLVDDDGHDAGTADRRRVHHADTPLHRAFSTYLADADGRVLLTRRALAKTTWAGVWTNSSCGHVRPGEDPKAAALRRVPEELGTPPTELRVALPDFRYRAVDASGVVENELCPVLVGRIDSDSLQVTPEEVAEVAWLTWEELRQIAARTPFLLSPWSVRQVEQLGDSPWR